MSDADDTQRDDELPVKPRRWPRWLWILMIALALLAIGGFVVLSVMPRSPAGQPSVTALPADFGGVIQTTWRS